MSSYSPQSNGPRFDWYFRRERQPHPELPASLWKRLLSRCELLYDSRVPLIEPFVRTPVHASVVNSALIWHGFVPHQAGEVAPRARVVPVFVQALYPASLLESAEALDKFLLAAWNRNFLHWLPLDPLQDGV